MNLTLKTAPDEYDIPNIVSVDRLKKDLRITHNQEDDIVEDCIKEAYAFFDGLEGWLNRSILTQTWTLSLPGFVKKQLRADKESRPVIEWVPTNVIELPLPPLQSVTSVKYRVSGVLTTLSASSYVVTKAGLFGKVYLADGSAWPTTIDKHPEAVEIEFIAGYGAGYQISSKARGIVSAMRLLACDRFRNREDTYTDPRIVEINRRIVNGVNKFAGRYKVFNDYA